MNRPKNYSELEVWKSFLVAVTRSGAHSGSYSAIDYADRTFDAWVERRDEIAKNGEITPYTKVVPQD